MRFKIRFSHHFSFKLPVKESSKNNWSLRHMAKLKFLLKWDLDSKGGLQFRNPSFKLLIIKKPMMIKSQKLKK